MQARIVGVLAGLWRLIFWIWSILIAGAIAGIVGNAAFTYFMTGSINFKDPRSLTVVNWLSAHIVLCLLIVTPVLLITLCSYLAHYRQLHAAQVHQQLHEETLVVIGKGVQRALDELSTRPAVPPTDPPPAEPVNPKTAWNVPYRRNPFFTGRDSLLKQLHERLATGKTTALTQAQAISGLGGIGKTQTAVEYAYRYRNEYQFVLWASAATRDSLVAGYVALAGVLNLPEKQEKNQNLVAAAVKQWLASHEQWLLILDNADDLSMAYEFLPASSSGHILLTTRAQSAGRMASSIEVDKMEEGEGTLLLLRRSKVLAADTQLDSVSQEDRSSAVVIVRQMDGLPLALDQAGAYIDETQCGLSAYLTLYQTRGKELIRWRSHLLTDYPATVATTWALSFGQVEQASAAAADLLRLCAFLAPDDIPEEIITEGASHLGEILGPVAADPFKLNEAIEILGRYSLVRRNATAKTLSIHRLVQAVLRESMQNKMQHHWAERTVRAVNQTFPKVEFTTWPQCKRLIAHAQACVDLVRDYSLAFPEAARLLTRAGWYLREHAQYTQAEPLLRAALAIYEQAGEKESRRLASTLANLGLLYRHQGKYAEAEPLFQRTLAIAEQELGATHPDTAQSLNNLAVLHQAQGKYAEAEPLYRRALTIAEQELGATHPYTATALNNLAGLYRYQGKYAEAEPLLRRALAICEQSWGPTHPNTVTIRENYVGLLKDMQQKHKGKRLS